VGFGSGWRPAGAGRHYYKTPQQSAAALGGCAEINPESIMFGFITGVLPLLLFWVLIGMAVLWCLRALNNIAFALRDVSERLVSLEAAVRQLGARSTT
jgi:hypothetical protein